MFKNKGTWFMALGAAAVLGTVNYVSADRTAAVAGDGCCPSQAGAATPVAMTGASDGACSYSKEAKSSGAMTEFDRANIALANAVEAGAPESRIRELSVKAGSAYAAAAREAAASWRTKTASMNTDSRPSFASWVTSSGAMGKAKMAGDCADKSACDVSKPAAAAISADAKCDLQGTPIKNASKAVTIVAEGKSKTFCSKDCAVKSLAGQEVAKAN